MASGDLYGDVGRYRHPSPTCEAFLAATPMIPRRHRATCDSRIKGHSYPQAWYEDAVGEVLAQIGRVEDWAITEVVRLHGEYAPRSDELTLARIGRAREDASQKLTKPRNSVACQLTMGQLNVEEAVAREPTDGRLRDRVRRPLGIGRSEWTRGARQSLHRSQGGSVPTKRMRLARVGKMPTTDVRRLISLLSRSRGLVRNCDAHDHMDAGPPSGLSPRPGLRSQSASFSRIEISSRRRSSLVRG